jgi:uncharacterized membrane protein HdeD (DUF308 family)
MPERINGGQALVAIGAIALIVSLFLNWYEPGRSAWTVFEVWDIVLAAIGIAAIAAILPARERTCAMSTSSRSAGCPRSQVLRWWSSYR